MKMKILAIALIGTLFLLAAGPMVQALESDSVDGERSFYLKDNGDFNPEDDDGLESDSVGGNKAIYLKDTGDVSPEDDEEFKSDSISGSISFEK